MLFFKPIESRRCNSFVHFQNVFILQLLKLPKGRINTPNFTTHKKFEKETLRVKLMITLQRKTKTIRIKIQ